MSDQGNRQTAAPRTTWDGTAAPTCNPPDVAADTNVFDLRDFILEAAGADYGTFCGDLAAVDAPENIIQGFSGSVSPAEPESRHSFDVGARAELLRVVLNAESPEPSWDFDLYVKAGAPPTPSDFDCAFAEPGQFGGCEFPDPAAGPWHVLVTQVAEAGTYQVTVVEVPEPAAVALLLAGASVLGAAALRRRS